jgi:transposase InsO family protein
MEIFAANRERYGSPGVTRELRQAQSVCGGKRVARLMHENGLAARRKEENEQVSKVQSELGLLYAKTRTDSPGRGAFARCGG